MKTRWIISLIGSLALLSSNAVLAHNDGYVYRPAGPGVNGGVAVWVNSYGNVQYAANLAYGAPRVYTAVPYYGHAHKARCKHRSHHAYERGYYEGRQHGHRRGHKHRYGKHHH